MEKRLISLTKPQTRWLKREAKQLGVSVSELVRRAIDEKKERSDDTK